MAKSWAKIVKENATNVMGSQIWFTLKNPNETITFSKNAKVAFCTIEQTFKIADNSTTTTGYDIEDSFGFEANTNEAQAPIWILFPLSAFNHLNKMMLSVIEKQIAKITSDSNLAYGYQGIVEDSKLELLAKLFTVSFCLNYLSNVMANFATIEKEWNKIIEEFLDLVTTEQVFNWYRKRTLELYERVSQNPIYKNNYEMQGEPKFEAFARDESYFQISKLASWRVDYQKFLEFENNLVLSVKKSDYVQNIEVENVATNNGPQVE